MSRGNVSKGNLERKSKIAKKNFPLPKTEKKNFFNKKKVRAKNNRRVAVSRAPRSTVFLHIFFFKLCVERGRSMTDV